MPVDDEAVEEVCGAMRQAARRGCGRVVTAAQAGAPLPALNAHTLSGLRVTVSLAGSRWHSYHTPAGICRRQLPAGDVLLAWPDVWVGTWYTEPNRALSAVLGADSTRALLLTYDPAQDPLGVNRGRIVRELEYDIGVNGDTARLRHLLLGSGDRPAWFQRHLTADLLWLLADWLASRRQPAAGKACRRWQQARRHIAEHCQHPLTRTDVARELGVHPNHLSRLFQRFDTEGFSGYLNHCRIDRVCRLLQDPALTIAEAARLSGYTNLSYFNRVFRRRRGMTPGAYRRRQS